MQRMPLSFVGEAKLRTTVYFLRGTTKDFLSEPVYSLALKMIQALAVPLHATAFCYMDHGYLKNNNAYAIIVPKNDLKKNPFFIPKTHTLCQLGGEGENFHAYTKYIKGLQNPYNPESESELSVEELDNYFTEYKSRAIFLAPHS